MGASGLRTHVALRPGPSPGQPRWRQSRPIEKGPQLHKLTITGIATLVAAAAFASTAGAEITKPGPGFLGPPVPAPTAPTPTSTTPSPIKVVPPVLKPTLTSPTTVPTKSVPVRIPAF
jgi:hypothetical protein